MQRIAALDILKGLVMVLMVLDHTRDYFTDARFSATDLDHTTAALFLTRWVTHLCAPTFLFLAGVGVYLAEARGTPRPVLSRRLILRGLWLVLLELTVIHVAWDFRGEYGQVGLGVLWAIGWSMVILALLLPLPRWVVFSLGLWIIGGHNLLDDLKAAEFGPVGPLWAVLHSGEPVPLGLGIVLHPYYRIGPWAAVMAVGYGCGSVLNSGPEARRTACVGVGGFMVLLFGALRFVNGYGDPHPWSAQSDPVFTALSFLDCTKYPPSLLYLLMTLGPALLLIRFFEHDRHRHRLTAWLAVYGRVPLFFYIVHLYFIHGLAVALVRLRGGDFRPFLASPFTQAGYPAGYGYSLAGVYGIWLAALIALYPACRWFAGVKLRRQPWWSSYL